MPVPPTTSRRTYIGFPRAYDQSRLLPLVSTKLTATYRESSAHRFQITLNLRSVRATLMQWARTWLNVWESRGEVSLELTGLHGPTAATRSPHPLAHPEHAQAYAFIQPPSCPNALEATFSCRYAGSETLCRPGPAEMAWSEEGSGPGTRILAFTDVPRPLDLPHLTERSPDVLLAIISWSERAWSCQMSGTQELPGLWAGLYQRGRIHGVAEQALYVCGARRAAVSRGVLACGGSSTSIGVDRLHAGRSRITWDWMRWYGVGRGDYQSKRPRDRWRMYGTFAYIFDTHKCLGEHLCPRTPGFGTRTSAVEEHEESVPPATISSSPQPTFSTPELVVHSTSTNPAEGVEPVGRYWRLSPLGGASLTPSVRVLWTTSHNTTSEATRIAAAVLPQVPVPKYYTHLPGVQALTRLRAAPGSHTVDGRATTAGSVGSIPYALYPPRLRCNRDCHRLKVHPTSSKSLFPLIFCQAFRAEALPGIRLSRMSQRSAPDHCCL
ncbi:hypothetical protein LXA43DRAFT_1069785 [Ganoderma leucocontextum]|nr:hypothetical protein LXA43DRAFT_1069785 [Ganoderma leucocontextum]